ncbi:MAG TPA: ATP-binding cassette domain-containing protein [Candidatus Paceibacterota bacterium]
MTTTSSITDRTRQQLPETLLWTEDLHYAYPQQSIAVLSELNLNVRKYSITALIGRSGGGKTTLFNIFCGFITPTNGWCYMGDKKIVGPSAERIPIFQEDGLWPWLTIIQNVTLVPLLSKGRSHAQSVRVEAARTLETVGIPERFHHSYVKHLSTGMKKRVELARALLARPTILLADEPFASIDVHTKGLLHDLLLKLWEKQSLTIFFSTHDLNEALYIASDILILNEKEGSSVIQQSVKNPFQGNRYAMREQTESYFRFYDSLHSQLFQTDEALV